MILCHLCSDGPLALRHLLFASKGLYYAAVNDAILWTMISFDYQFFKHFWDRSEQAKSFTTQCLRWSSSLPLCIRINGDEFNRFLVLGSLRALNNPKYRGFERCTSLTWYHRRWDYLKVEEIIAMLPKELPSLRHLSLTYVEDPRNGTLFPNCPVLEKLEMSEYRQHSYFSWTKQTQLAHVTTLSFGNDYNWATCDINTLSLFPALRHLTLFTTHSSQPGRLYSSTYAPLFQHLQTLRVRGQLPLNLFTKLEAPALKALHIEANRSGQIATGALRDSLTCLCLHLYALLPESVTRTEPQWASDLSEFVHKCTRIETLFVSKWMEEECITFLDGSNVVLHVL